MYEKGLGTRCLVESQVAQAHFLIFLLEYHFIIFVACVAGGIVFARVRVWQNYFSVRERFDGGLELKKNKHTD